jgi:hypothetical protein
MKIVHGVPKRAYINVMELLVAEEVDQQLQGLPPRVVKYLKGVEVETYALNRLPALYASSEKGWQHQYEKAKRELHNQIKSAVRQALAAVQVDPIRSSEPIQVEGDEAAEGALDSLRDLLKQPDLSWEGAVNRLKLLLSNRSTEADPNVGGGAEAASHRTRYRQPPADPRHPAPPPPPPTVGTNRNGQQSQHWRPGTYGAGVSWQRSHNSSEGKTTDFDWGDSRYSK